MRITILSLILLMSTCSEQKTSLKDSIAFHTINLPAMLDTIWYTEQTPIRMRDSLIKVYGTDSKEVEEQQKIYIANHAINELKIMSLLDSHGWPEKNIIGDQGNLTICNVLQHSEIEIRQKYLPIMREAVNAKKLHPRFLARAEDRLATDKGELQLYGGQIKFYPETKTFDVWPIYDPENVDKRRAKLGLEPMAEFLSSKRFQLEWNLEEQVKRTKDFELKKQSENKKEN